MTSDWLLFSPLYKAPLYRWLFPTNFLFLFHTVIVDVLCLYAVVSHDSHIQSFRNRVGTIQYVPYTLTGRPENKEKTNIPILF